MTVLFLSALAVAFSGAMMPGPLLTYTIRQSLHTGPLAGFFVIIGHAVLEITLIVLIFLGFDMVLQSGTAQVAIGMVGGILLAYMGYDMIKGAVRNRISIDMDGNGSDKKNMLLSGFLVSASNPYFLLWWAIIGLGFLIRAYTSYGIAGVMVFYAGHVLADFLWYGFISAVVGTTRRFIRLDVYRGMIIFLGCVLVFFGFNFLYKAIAAIA